MQVGVCLSRKLRRNDSAAGYVSPSQAGRTKHCQTLPRSRDRPQQQRQRHRPGPGVSALCQHPKGGWPARLGERCGFFLPRVWSPLPNVILSGFFFWRGPFFCPAKKPAAMR